MSGVWSRRLLERCPHLRGCHVQAELEFGVEDGVSLLERCHISEACMYMYTSGVPIRGVFISEGVRQSLQ